MSASSAAAWFAKATSCNCWILSVGLEKVVATRRRNRCDRADRPPRVVYHTPAISSRCLADGSVVRGLVREGLTRIDDSPIGRGELIASRARIHSPPCRQPIRGQKKA